MGYLKKCTKCNIEKELTCFYLTKKTNIYSSWCKECSLEQKRNFYKKNIDKFKEYRKIQYIKHRDKRLESIKKYRDNNRELIRERDRLRNQSEKRKKYKEDNREVRNQYYRKYEKEKIKTNPLYKLKKRMRCVLYRLIKNRKTIDIIGCSYDELLTHLNNNPYGFRFEDNIYDIDHIIPLSSAKNKDEMKKLNHYTNLQLLPSEYNQHIKKDGIWDEKHFEEWLLTNKIIK